MERVSSWLQGQDEPATFTKIKESVDGTDSYIATATEFLIDEGYATEESGSRGARLVCHKVLFTGQERPLRNPAQAKSEVSQTAPTVSSHSSTPATPAAPLREGVISPLRDLQGNAGVMKANADVTPAAKDIDVFDPAVQAQLGDDDIPF